MIRQTTRSVLYLLFYAPLRAWILLTGRAVEGRYYRDQYFRMLRRLGFHFTHTIESRQFLFDPSLSAMGHKLYFDGELERPELETIRPYVRPDSIVLDVGANIGLYTVFFSVLAPRGRVYAFEPSKETLRLLLRNVHDLPPATPVCMGLSNVTGEAEFHITSDNALSGLKDTGRSPVVSVERILTMTGDDFVRSFAVPRVDIIKIDVEGLEREVFEGLEKTILKHHPVILCEVYQGTASNPDPVRTIREVEALGYEAFVVHSDGPVRFDGKHDDASSNYLFRPAGRS